MKKQYIQPTLKDHKLQIVYSLLRISDNTINDESGIPSGEDNYEQAPSKAGYFDAWE